MAIPATLDEFRSFLATFAASRAFDDIAVTLGVDAQGADGESISMSMPLTDALAQVNGMFSATALFGAADITATLLALQAFDGRDGFPLAVQSNLNFLSNSQASPAVATASFLRRGNTLSVVETVVTDAEGKRLAQATFTYAVKARKLGR